ncbi:MAG TPA: cohesin domain-containing protein [Pyrinomonadaceae bacterium]|jgi:hypothetical protein
MSLAGFKVFHLVKAGALLFFALAISLLFLNEADAKTAANAPPSCANVSISTTITTPRNVTVTVPINVDDLTGRGVLSFDFRVTYDPMVLSAPVVSNAGTLSSAMVITVNGNTPGLLIISGYDKNELSGMGVLLNLSFTASGQIGSSSDVNFTSFAFNEGDPCSNTSNGHVRISSGTISGANTYSNAMSPPVPVPNVLLSATGSVNVSTNSDFGGLYALSGLGAGAYMVTPSKSGDVNGITGFDSALIAQHVVELITLNATQLLAADVSQSNTVTSFDAALIAQYVVFIPNPGITGTWKFSPPVRNYPNVETDYPNQDYGAILMGEVSGNWTPPTMFAGSQPARAQAPPQLGVSAPNMLVVAGQNFTIPVTVQDTTGLSVISYQFDLLYNPSVIQPQATPASLTGTISDGMSLTFNPVSPGVLKVVVFGTTNRVGAGTLLNFKFTAVGPVGSVSPLAWQAFLFNEGNPQSVPTNGQVTLVGPTAASVLLSGRVLRASGRGVPYAHVTLLDERGQTRMAISNPLGYYRFDEVEAGQTYVVSATAKGLVFAAQAVLVNGEVSEFNLTASP